MNAAKQNITGHLRYTERLVASELDQRRRGIDGLGSIEDLTSIERIVWEEGQRQATPAAYEQVRHPLGEMIAGWPTNHPLTVALQAIVDHAWLRVEFGPGGRFSFPDPGEISES